MKNLIFLLLLMLLFSCKSINKSDLYKNQFFDGYTIEYLNNIKKIKKSGYIKLVISNEFNDTIEVFKNKVSIWKLVRKDFGQIDENGDLIVVKDGPETSHLMKIDKVNMNDSISIKLKKEKFKLDFAIYPGNIYQINKYNKYIIINIDSDLKPKTDNADL